MAVTVGTAVYTGKSAASRAAEQKKLQVRALKQREKEFNASQDFFKDAALTTQANAELARRKEAVAFNAAQAAGQPDGLLWLLWLLLAGAAVLVAIFFFKRKG